MNREGMRQPRRVVAAWLLLALAGCGHGTSGDNAGLPRDAAAVQPVPVTTAAVTPRPVRRTVEAVGTLEGHEEVSIAPKVEGRIVRIYHDIGDEVAPGEPLADIEDVDYRLSVAEAQRGMELELARLGLTALPAPGKFDLTKVPGVARARNVEENARMVLDRARRLGRVIATEELERAQTEARIAQAGRQQAEMEALATLAAARFKQAQLETARQKQTDARVLAPTLSAERLPPGLTQANQVRYVVAARKVSEGEMVRTMQAPVLFRLVIAQSLKLVLTVPEAYIAEVRHGQSVALRVEAYPAETFAGVVRRINPTVDRTNRTFTVEVAVPNPARRLRAGSFAKASILSREADQARTVPEEAIVRFAGVVKVFVVEKERARAVEVRIGEAMEVAGPSGRQRWIEVEGDLPVGAAVVTSGQTGLANDTPVRVRTPGRDE